MPFIIVCKLSSPPVLKPLLAYLIAPYMEPPDIGKHSLKVLAFVYIQFLV